MRGHGLPPPETGPTRLWAELYGEAAIAISGPPGGVRGGVIGSAEDHLAEATGRGRAMAPAGNAGADRGARRRRDQDEEAGRGETYPSR
jgi:hypothetical protein